MVTYRACMNCYILVGGHSRRMGRSKAELFLDRVLAAARPVFDEVIVLDRDSEPRAPIFGVAEALRQAGKSCFILAVDYPLITSDVLRWLRDAGAVPEWNGRPQYLCAVWDAALLSRVEERIAAGRLDLHGLQEGEIIAESEIRGRFGGEPLMNVNTPEELARAERWYGS